MSRLGRNILYNVVGQGLALVLGFVAVRLIYRDLGDDAVGIVFFALTLNNVLVAVSDLGMSTTMVRELAAGGLAHRQIQGLLRTASLFYWSSYVILGTLLVLAAGYVTREWLNVGALDASTAEISFRILAVGSLLAVPKSLYSSVFRGLQRMGITNTIDVCAMALQQVGIMTTIALGGSLIAVSWWIAFSTAAVVGAYAAAASRVVPARALLPGLDVDAIRRNRGYASRMTVVSALAMIHTHADKLIAGWLLPLGQFGLYGFGFYALNRGMLLTGAVAQAAFPSLSELEGSGHRERLLAQYRRLHEVVSYTMAVVFAAAPFAAPPVFTWLFGISAANLMLLPSTLLALGFYMNSTLNMPYMLSLAMAKPNLALSLNAWAIIAVLPLTVVFIWHWGLLGAAMSWVVYHIFAYLYFVPRVCRECDRSLPIRSWYVDVAKFMIPAAMIYSTAWLTTVTAVGPSARGLALAYLIGTVVYCALAWRVMSSDARDRLQSISFSGRLKERHGV